MQASAPVVFITRKWAPATGGMETWSLRMVEALSQVRQVDVIALPGRANGMPPGALALLGWGIVTLARLLLRRAPATAVHLGDMALWPLGLVAPRTAALVLSAHGTDVAYHRRGGFRGGLYGAYLKLGARLLPRARVIANSAATRTVLAESGWAAQAVIPLGVAPCHAPGSVAHDGSILFAGRLVRRKGCGWFIAQVLPLLPPGTVLKVAGTSWDEAERAALAHPQVRFLGPLTQDDLAAHYARALCVIAPNIEVPEGEFEGFGLVAPEAAAAGGVVLAAASGGLTDAVIDGETGFLLPSGDAPAWAARIAEVAGWSDATRASFTRWATAKARTRYSWDRVAADTARLYEAA